MAKPTISRRPRCAADDRCAPSEWGRGAPTARAAPARLRRPARRRHRRPRAGAGSRSRGAALTGAGQCRRRCCRLRPRALPHRKQSRCATCGRGRSSSWRCWSARAGWFMSRHPPPSAHRPRPATRGGRSRAPCAERGSTPLIVSVPPPVHATARHCRDSVLSQPLVPLPPGGLQDPAEARAAMPSAATRWGRSGRAIEVWRPRCATGAAHAAATAAAAPMWAWCGARPCPWRGRGRGRRRCSCSCRPAACASPSRSAARAVEAWPG
jgi:hypothetical protein